MSDAALLDRAADALLRLAADRPWSQISLREIAAGKVHFNRASHGAVVEYIAMVNKREFGT